MDRTIIIKKDFFCKNSQFEKKFRENNHEENVDIFSFPKNMGEKASTILTSKL